MLELVVVDGVVRGIVTRQLLNGQLEAYVADAVCLATGGYSNVFYLSTNAKGCNVTAIWRAHRQGAFFANPCFTQIHPTCIPVTGEYQSKLTLMSESLRNDGRVWVPKTADDKRPPHELPEGEHDYFLERKYPAYGNLVLRDVASRSAKELLEQIPALREEFWRDVTVTGSPGTFNQVLERAGRVADFLEFAATLVLDALERRESCGRHFREEHQTEDGEARRNDAHYCHVSAWEFKGVGTPAVSHQEPLRFEYVHPTQRSYK
jgi:succinate dehydrogenase/fumarate reductase flavoprotein subunit